MIRSYLDENKQVTPWDSALVAYYQEKDEFFWLNDSLVSDKPATQPADSLLYWLGNISKHGIHPGLTLQIVFVTIWSKYVPCNCKGKRQ